jgi:hypothetical protein
MRKMIMASLFMMVAAFGASSNAAEDQKAPNKGNEPVVEVPAVDGPAADPANHQGVCSLSCTPCTIGSACPRDPFTGGSQTCVRNCF